MITKLNVAGLRALTLATADLRGASFQYSGEKIVYGRYRLSYLEAAELACKQLQLSVDFATPVALGLSSCLNDMLDWAGDHEGRVPTVTIPKDFQFPQPVKPQESEPLS